ncbi:unnamed protein product [Chrysodeixis includens]|uniref:Uncharacterized protein n=1 Tax=Chrysodeixis includens TaxID=689277 RepID=A0A9N8PZF1_CHRIL|nr:unnamed protein product [Chrysodeixis includens]
MVLRIDPKIKKFKEETFLGDYTMSKVYGNPKEVVERHDLIFKTELAHPRERLTYPLRIGTLHQKYDELLGQQVLTYTYEKVSAAVLDCGEWLPNYWGNFICIANDYQLKTLTAGSMLVSHYKLFGIGSFAYFRGGEGVLVFTDVRLYSEQIMNACTHTDWEDD